MRYGEFTLEGLAEKFKATGENEVFDEILARLSESIRSECRAFNIPGYDIEDKLQEAQLSLLNSLSAFNPGGGSSLKSFVKFCLRRRLTDLYRARNAASAVPSRCLLSLDEPSGGGDTSDGVSLGEMLPSQPVTCMVELGATVSEMAQRAVFCQFDKLRAIADNSAPIDSIFGAGVVSYVREKLNAGYLSIEVAETVLGVFEINPEASLFADTVDRYGVEDLLREYFVLQYLVIQDVASNFESEGDMASLGRVALAHGISVELVKTILASIRLAAVA